MSKRIKKVIIAALIVCLFVEHQINVLQSKPGNLTVLIEADHADVKRLWFWFRNSIHTLLISLIMPQLIEFYPILQVFVWMGPQSSDVERKMAIKSTQVFEFLINKVKFK